MERERKERRARENKKKESLDFIFSYQLLVYFF